VVYSKTYEARLGAASARAYSFGPGHTGADTVVYFPDLKAVAMGDLLVEATPNYDAGIGGGSILGFDHSLGEALKLDFDVAFPGHGGEPMTKAQVAAYKAKFDTLIARLRAAIKAGTPKDKLIASIKTDDLGFKLGGQFWAPAPRVDALVAELSAK
jgi:glyoxylase-like metal-dependent hydrolase (beta-lactamase superfamily II)